MRHTYPDLVEKGRVVAGFFASGRGDRCGAFVLRRAGVYVQVIASDGADWPGALPAWEHVSVSVYPDGLGRGHRVPTWDEMAWAKDLFWGPDECVVQFHVPAADHVNNHPSCLHLWRPVGADLPRPPAWAVGVPDGGAA